MMTQEQLTLRNEMLSEIEVWKEGLEETPENINWMYAVNQIDNSFSEGLNVMLDTMDRHYPGINANSNREMIVEKIYFDMHQNGIFGGALMQAVELGWIDFDDLNNFMEHSIFAQSIEINTSDGNLAIEANLGIGYEMEVLVYGKTRETMFLDQQYCIVSITANDYIKLSEKIKLIDSDDCKIQFFMLFLKSKGAELLPYSFE